MKATPAYKQFLETFAVFSEADRHVTALDASVNEQVHEIIDTDRDEYLTAIATRKQAEDAVRQWATDHPEWFNGKQSLKTPHGTVSKRKTRSLEIENEPLAVRLVSESYGRDVIIVQNGEDTTLKGAAAIQHVLGAAAEFLRVEITLDREALEKLTDEELQKLGIARKTTETITPKPLKVDLGKEIEAAAPKPAATAAA